MYAERASLGTFDWGEGDDGGTITVDLDAVAELCKRAGATVVAQHYDPPGMAEKLEEAKVRRKGGSSESYYPS
jgi:hypothetical protein